MIYAFDGFEADDSLFELRRDGTPVAVQRKVLDLLLYLLRHRHRVVLKGELLHEVWEGIAVTDNAVAQVVSAARRAIDDTGAEPAIATVRGRGYRFMRAVEERSPARAASAPPPRLTLLPAEPRAAYWRASVATRRMSSRVVVTTRDDGISADAARELGARGAPIVVDGLAPRAAGPLGPWLALARACLDQRPELRGSPAGLLAARVLSGARAPDSLDALDMIVELLRLAASFEPVVAILEHVDRADPASLLLLAHAKSALESLPIAIVATCEERSLGSDCTVGRVLRSLLAEELSPGSGNGRPSGFEQRAVRAAV